MYKVKDAADQLGVSRVEIFEILLSRREEFNPYVIKNNSITYITDEGMILLKSVFFPELENTTETVAEDVAEVVDLIEDEEVPISEMSVESDELNNTMDADGDIEGLETPLDEVYDFDSGEVIFDINEEEALLAASDSSVKEIFLDMPTQEPYEIGAEDDLAGQWLKEIQIEDEQAAQLDIRLRELRTQVTGLRNKILVLDSEIKRKDEAIKHYHEIMKDDIQWLEDIEQKLLLMMGSQVERFEASSGEITEEVAGKMPFFKFFKR